MIQLIVGNKGKGKTKHLLNKVNDEIKEASGNIVYLDKDTRHMYDLNNKIRLINTGDYKIQSPDEFIGFVSGIIAADHDLEQIYIDCFLTIACIIDDNYGKVLEKLDSISDKYNINLVISISKNENEIIECMKSKIIISL